MPPNITSAPTAAAPPPDTEPTAVPWCDWLDEPADLTTGPDGAEFCTGCGSTDHSVRDT